MLSLITICIIQKYKHSITSGYFSVVIDLLLLLYSFPSWYYYISETANYIKEILDVDENFLTNWLLVILLFMLIAHNLFESYIIKCIMWSCFVIFITFDSLKSSYISY